MTRFFVRTRAHKPLLRMRRTIDSKPESAQPRAAVRAWQKISLLAASELKWIISIVVAAGCEHAKSRQVIMSEEARCTVFLQRGDCCWSKLENRNDNRALLKERIVTNEIGRIPGLAPVERDDVLGDCMNSCSGSGVGPNKP